MEDFRFNTAQLLQYKEKKRHKLVKRILKEIIGQNLAPDNNSESQC